MKELMKENFEKTQEFIKGNSLLRQSIVDSVNHSSLYNLDYEFLLNDQITYETTKYKVLNARSFASLDYFSNDVFSPCVLNFASATNPGGGVLKGSLAQEESLCRCSTLYNVISNEKFKQGYYDYHKRMHNPIYTSKIIYSPNIMIINTDTNIPTKLPESEWKQVNIITCAVPNLRDREKVQITDNEFLELMKSRIRRICRCAIKNENDGIVLGAFGCGAFRCNPHIVARAFKEVLVNEKYEKYFKEIIFAVYCPQNQEKTNLNAFMNYFGDK